MLIKTFNYIKALETLDEAGVEVFGNRGRFFWSPRSQLSVVKVIADVDKAGVHGPYPTSREAIDAALASLSSEKAAAA